MDTPHHTEYHDPVHRQAWTIIRAQLVIVMSQSAVPTSEIVADDKWTDGDFKLISSGNVSFNVNRYNLQAHRWVLSH